MALATGLLFGLPAVAKEGDTFRPTVSYARYFDNNLFRLAESEYALVPERSDQYGVLSAGLNVDWQPGRQQLLVSANKTQVRYSRNAQLDNDGSDYSLKWNWRVGNYWSGQVGATETVSQSDFTNLGTQINNQVTSENRFASARWQIHPRFSAELGASETVVTNSTVQRKPLDYEAKSASATLKYSTPKGSNLQGQVVRINGEYTNRLASIFVDRAYTQTEYNLISDWSFSGKVIPHAKIGYIQRENDTVSQRNFSGFAGRLSADYYPTGKTALNWAVYRELGNSDDINASYQINTGTSLGAAWRATSKITLRTNVSYENRSFQGGAGFAPPGLVQRDEDTLSGALSMSYAPVRPVTIDLGLQAGRRDSNISANDYTFNMFYVSLRADF
ncbi:MAG: putative exosortase B-associated extracellular polysaccharide biosynthesis transporter EpsL [Sulfuriferula multivorans]|uniref:Putative exosortase B-associated extracellular polysaccharide biosynthesis transporter EpsL n=1 Tax=Sulfuriferula multivorans TaxID=1559896 RepID=A0A7C9JVD0_9PROT|nr:putative exosortase B-associated extracellular polysaccharide biosynthesis transporter EpsL [Sulfuriferula multivorans]